MNDLKWFFPKSGLECQKLFLDGNRPHAGGTFLIKTNLNSTGLFDINRVKDYCKTAVNDNNAIIGAAVSYADAAAFINSIAEGSFISIALSSAASTPLRNRISIGGSIAAAPKWSDIIAPFAAAGVSVVLEEDSKSIPYSAYAIDRDMRRNSLVASVSVPVKNLSGYYFRCTLTGFDYPLFTIAVSLRDNGTLHCAFSGIKEGLVLIEGKTETVLSEAEKRISFNNERGLSAEYLKNRALTELERLLTSGGLSNE